jgi:UDP-N-acetyl-D-mannosaminuronate dehydrogenase
MQSYETLVVGVGEVGGALADVIERTFPVWRQDLDPLDYSGPVDVMHLCIPYRSAEQFEEAALHYLERFKPHLTIINSTVLPGTTRSIARRSGNRVAFSPVRGKHANMKRDLIHYVKFIAAPDPDAARVASDFFRAIGMRTQYVDQVEALELAKLAETTYFGTLIAFAQELNRYASRLGVDYEQAIGFFEEIKFLPPTRYFPGFIGGHCVIPNIHLLQRIAPSVLLDAILESNQRRAAELGMTSAQERPRETGVQDG